MTSGLDRQTQTPAPVRDYEEQQKGSGWVLFAGIMLLTAGTFSIIYGIAAIDRANFFVNNSRYVFSDLNTWGWILLVLGVLEITAAFSIWQGGQFGRWFGIVAATLNMLGALGAIQSYPAWSLFIAAIDLLVIYGLAAYGGQVRYAAD